VIDPIERVRLDWVSVRPSRIHGFGLFARAFIPAQSYIGDYAGPPVEEDGRHVLWIEDDNGKWAGVDGSNVLRYLNHNATPNTELNGIELYALCDIERGEEITIHYGEDWAEGNPTVPDSVVAA
jgi:SET domain-containing protein